MSLGAVLRRLLELVRGQVAARERDVGIQASQDEADRLGELLRKSDWELERWRRRDVQR